MHKKNEATANITRAAHLKRIVTMDFIIMFILYLVPYSDQHFKHHNIYLLLVDIPSKIIP